MRYLIILFILAGCAPQASVNPTFKRCTQGFYGDNCDKLYGDQIAGNYSIFVSATLRYHWHNPNGQTWDTVQYIYNTHDAVIFDTMFPGDTADHMFIINNFWGNGERAAIEPLGKDSFICYNAPSYKGRGTGGPFYFYPGHNSATVDLRYNDNNSPTFTYPSNITVSITRK